MSEEPGNYSQAFQTIGGLKQECYRLIDVVARRPGAIKLLLGCKEMLTTLSEYKANRKFGPRKSGKD